VLAGGDRRCGISVGSGMAITVETALDRRMITAIIASSLGFSLDLFDLFILLYVAEPSAGGVGRARS
jgi:hypothetical protein